MPVSTSFGGLIRIQLIPEVEADGETVLATIHVAIPVGSENSVPEEVDHREIAVRVQTVDKVKLLLASEPSKACEPRSFGMVLLVKNYVYAERHDAGSGHCKEQIEWKKQIHPTCDDDCGDEKVGVLFPSSPR